MRLLYLKTLKFFTDVISLKVLIAVYKVNLIKKSLANIQAVPLDVL